MSSKNKSRYALLGVLSYGPKSGYDIKKTLEKSVSYFWSESYGQIYPMLKQLVTDKFATCKTDTTPGGRTKSIYTITAKGRKELKTWLTQPVEHTPIRDELLLKLFFGWQVTPDVNLKHIQQARQAYQEIIEFLKFKTKDLSKRLPDHPALDYWLITLNNGIASYDGLLDWCDQAEKKLKRLKS